MADIDTCTTVRESDSWHYQRQQKMRYRRGKSGEIPALTRNGKTAAWLGWRRARIPAVLAYLL